MRDLRDEDAGPREDGVVRSGVAVAVGTAVVDQHSVQRPDRACPRTKPGTVAFRLVFQLQVEPVEVDPLWAHADARAVVKSWTVAASVPPPGAVAFQWSVRRIVNENRISPE